MQNFKLVLPEHMNHYGDLYGGNMLKWVDESAWIAASRDFPGSRFVTIGLDDVAFHLPVQLGSILRFESQRTHKGRTSVRYAVQVFAEHIESGRAEPVFTATVSFVNLDPDRNKRPIAPPPDS